MCILAARLESMKTCITVSHSAIQLCHLRCEDCSMTSHTHDSYRYVKHPLRSSTLTFYIVGNSLEAIFNYPYQNFRSICHQSLIPTCSLVLHQIMHFIYQRLTDRVFLKRTYNSCRSLVNSKERSVRLLLLLLVLPSTQFLHRCLRHITLRPSFFVQVPIQ